ncbi:G-protein coupled receptor dmsr-1 [Aethina tumida]|uniref:G-protein coupled receptor dmsr-1 n=1 Tax=Aethina tumida TaxID=116153 RepID=UPI00096B394B|nr:G-protein coupled receptor dmsr-1 [Aethina tumida]
MMLNVDPTEFRDIVKKLNLNLSDGDVEQLIIEKMASYTNITNTMSMSMATTTSTSTPHPSDDNLYCGGYLEQIAETYGDHYHPYVAITVCLFGTLANISNIAVLTRKDMASAPVNRILTALAFADMMLMLEYIPFAYYYHIDLKKKFDFPYIGAVFMIFHIHTTQVLHTISICLTLTLAVWRFLAIGYPERNHILCSETRCRLAISLSYCLPVVLCLPTFFTLKISTTTVTENNETFVLYHTILSDAFQNEPRLLQINFWIYAVFIKLLPCTILTFISFWLIRTLFKAKRRKQVLRGYDTYPLTQDGAAKKKVSKAERRADRTTKMLVAVLMLFLITEFPQGLFALLIGLRGKTLFLQCYQKYGEVMDILALLNGAINFILYCCMNRMFRTTFGQLFKSKIMAKWPANVPSEIHTTVVPNGTNTTEL